MPLPKETLYTADYIEALPDGERAELIDGRLYMMSAPTPMHQLLIAELSRTIGNYIHEKGGLCRVFPSPFAVYPGGMTDICNYVEPDISIICDPEKWVNGRGCDGAPDWIIEVASPSTRSRDYLYKLAKYRETGVREYWIVNPDSRTVVVFDFENEEGSNTWHFTDDIPVNIYPGFSINIDSLL